MSDPFRDIQKQLGMISQATNSYNSLFKDLKKANSFGTAFQSSLLSQFDSELGLFRSTSSILSQFKTDSEVTSNFRDLTRVNSELTKLVSTASIADSSLSKIFADHNSLRSSIPLIASEPSVTHLLSSMDTTRLLHTSLASQFRLLSLEAASIGSCIDASAYIANDLTSTFSKFTSSYRELIECIPNIPEHQIPFIAKHSPAEYLLEINVLEQISVEDIEENEDTDGWGCLPSVDEELESFDDRLLILLNGARESLNSDNPDRARHVTTSVRELFTQILHGLAPDDKIRAWSGDKDHFHNGRPTRRARLLYICRDLSCKPLEKFVENDVQAALTLVDSLNAGTHVVESKLTEHQLKAIVHRMESLVLYLINVSKVI